MAARVGRKKKNKMKILEKGNNPEILGKKTAKFENFGNFIGGKKNLKKSQETKCSLHSIKKSLNFSNIIIKLINLYYICRI